MKREEVITSGPVIGRNHQTRDSLNTDSVQRKDCRQSIRCLSPKCETFNQDVRDLRKYATSCISAEFVECCILLRHHEMITKETRTRSHIHLHARAQTHAALPLASNALKELFAEG